MPYEEFPWFKDAVIGQIINMQELSPGHFYWLDLSVEITKQPERFPLVTMEQALPFLYRLCPALLPCLSTHESMIDIPRNDTQG